MQRTPVTSSNIKSVGWHDNVLEVEFLNGSCHRYYGVDAEMHKAMCSAESVGKFLNSTLKGKFSSRKKERR